MKFLVMAFCWASLGVHSADESEISGWDPWPPRARDGGVNPSPVGFPQQMGAVPQPMGTVPQPMGTVPQPMGTVPWWSGMSQGGEAMPTSQHVPVAKPSQRNAFAMPSQVVQKRTRLPAPSDQQPSLSTAGIWTSNTGQGVKALQAQLSRLFQSPAGGKGWGNPDVEVFVPVENLMNALAELTKLIQVVVTFCEEERHPGGSYSSAEKFPADTFLRQGARYAKRVTNHLRSLRDLLSAVLAPSVTKKAVDQAVDRFRATTADAKEVYQIGCQVADAAVGAVLPYMSTCSFFPKGDPNGNYRLWSYMGARISSMLRYLYHVTTDLHAVAGKLKYLVSGKIEPQSVGDLARSRVLFRAVNSLETAEARSISAVRYFNELAAAYYNHIGSSNPSGQDQDTNARHSVPQMDGDGVNELEELSLLLDDLGAENVVHPENDGFPDGALQTAALQTAADGGAM